MLTLFSLIFASKRQPFHWPESFQYDFLINWAERTIALNCWPCFLLQDSHGYIGESFFLIRYVISFIFKDAIIFFGNIFCHPRISKCIPLHITMLIEVVVLTCFQTHMLVSKLFEKILYIKKSFAKLAKAHQIKWQIKIIKFYI